MPAQQNNLIWIDLEMTGLDCQTHEIIEIATIITDAELNILAEGPVLAIHQPDHIIDHLDEWNTHYHGKSGLIDRVKASDVSYADAQEATLAFVRQYVPKRQSPMCGNSICQDRRFMARLMPDLERFFHYRNLDVSTLKELAKRWYPKALYQKQSTHTALADIKDSIDELRHYRQQLFIKNHEPD